MKNNIYNLNINDPYSEFSIYTLGPAGTSSEFAANYLSIWLKKKGYCKEVKIVLKKTYEVARQEITEKNSILLVANAYADINLFYMDYSLTLGAVFVLETPSYGIVTKTGELPENKNTLLIASHPAPVPIISQLLPNQNIKQIVKKNSTSSAALAVLNDEVDAALTTQIAAKNYNLLFVTKTRTINMLWSAFVYDSSSYYAPK
jgi:hypothetical protein